MPFLLCSAEPTEHLFICVMVSTPADPPLTMENSLFSIERAAQVLHPKAQALSSFRPSTALRSGSGTRYETW